MLLRCFFKTYFRPTVPHFSFIVLRYSTTVDYKIVNSYWTRNFGPLIATIVKNQWFSGSPLPLNEWFGKHPLEPMEWQWFFSMATIGTNGMAMVFNGLQPLVIRWNGNDPSLWSLWNLLQWQWAHAGMLIADCDQFDSALTRRGLLNQYLCENWMLDAVTI